MKFKVLETIIHDSKDGKEVTRKSDELGYYAMINYLGEATIIIDEDNSFEASVSTHSHRYFNKEIVETIRNVNNKVLYGLYRIK